MIRKFIRFFGLGGATYLVNIGLTFCLVNFLFFSQEKAYFIALTVVSIINFFASLKLIFGVNYHIKTLVYYVSFLFLFAVGNFLLVDYLKGIFGENYFFLIIFFVTTFFFFLKFFVYNRFVFIKRV